MENVWEKLKSLKGRSWVDTKDILNKIVKDIPLGEDIVVAYNVNSETLPAEEREIYGVYPKSEPFYLERCKICSNLLKPCVLAHHHDLHHKRNITNAKKTSFVSPGKKKHGKKGNKSTSEDDSESVISSEAPSPVVDLQESQSNDSNTGTTRDDSNIDVISVDEIPSEESKPPTPGPQDFYEEFAVPYSEEIQVISSTAESIESCKPIYSNSKSVLKLKISSSKDSNVKASNTTSLLEAHLLSNTKYNTAGNASTDTKFRNHNYKFGSTFAKNDGKGMGSDQNARKFEEVADQAEWKSISPAQTGSPKLKTETKISIPISVLPQTVKIIGPLKKSVAAKPSQMMMVGHSPSNLDSSESCIQQPSSPYSIDADANAAEMLMLNGVKKSTKSKRNKRSKAKNRSAKTTEFDADKHCGVLLDENRRCLRSLTCKTHAIALKRAVEGRCKEFDKLLADHRASKEAQKEQDRSQPISSCEPSASIPISNSDNPPASSDPEIIKIRVPNVNLSNPEVTHNSSNFEQSQDDIPSPKIEIEIASPKIPYNLKPVTATGVKPVNVIGKVSQNASSMNGEVKPQIYDSDIKISFVCSDMLYKVGGLLYMDRSRQAIRKCMEPLISTKLKNQQLKRPINKQKITDFLQLVKNCAAPPARLHVFEDDKSGNLFTTVKAENIVAIRDELSRKAHDELERMRHVLSNSTKILNNVAADENEMRKFRASARLKRRSDRLKHLGAKKIKQESLSDENYDINTLLSFDKCIAKTEEVGQFATISSDGYAAAFAGMYGAEKAEGRPATTVAVEMPYDVYLGQENGNASSYADETAQLLQTYKDLENEIRNTVGPDMQELYPAQPMTAGLGGGYMGYVEGATAPTGMEFKGGCESDYKAQMDNHIEETISKNYSLLEEYCKNISTDELFMDNKNELYYENGAPMAGNGKMKNEVASSAMYGGERAEVPAANQVDGLNYDTQLLNSFLSSISVDAAGAQNANEMNYAAAGRQYEMAPERTMTKERVYEEILKLSKPFQDSAAVNIEKPPTPNPVVYTGAENDEVLKWLF